VLNKTIVNSVNFSRKCTRGAS